RLAGTVVGAVTGAALSLLPPGPLAVGVAIFAAMMLSNALRFESAAKLAGYVCGIVILDHHGEPWRYAVLRFVETVIGIAAAVGVSLVPKLLPLRR
ncbi:MAG TPA: FUSC family protein, partial [Casimicrobiaceae bacterium]|nr:FUSC family protein [Casimicrobiaceae bacterium]